MERNAIFEKLTTIFREVFKDDNIVATEDQTSEDVKTWDSLTNMQMVAAVEKEFGIKLQLREIMKWKNVGNMADSIAKKI